MDAVRGFVSFVLVLLVACFSSASLSEAEDGIAKKYLRDVGIESDPDVIFGEMFEAGSVGEIAGRWTNTQNTAGMSLSSDVPPDSSGSRSLLMTSIGGTNTGGHLYRKLTPG